MGPLAIAVIGSLGLNPLEAKPILLRNERIETPANRPQAAALQAIEPPRSGLFLVQFEGPLRMEWRDQLNRNRVVILRTVPEDACVARLTGVKLSQVRSLPFVHWVEEYRPDHKVHAALRMGRARARDALHVRVLVAPDAGMAETAQVRNRFQTIRRQGVNRWGAVIQGETPAAQVPALARSSSVLWIEPVQPTKLYDEVAAKIVGGGEPFADSGTHQTAVHELGFDGSGVTVAVADSGLDLGAADSVHPDLLGRVEAFFFYGQLGDASDEHGHGTHVTGIVAGDGATGETDEFGALFGLGLAPSSRIVVQRLFDGVGNYEPPSRFDIMTADAVRSGAEIGSNSWGEDTQGRYDLSAAEFDALVRDADPATPGDQPYILEFSAGNSGPGPQTIGSPAVAKNVIATGASQNDRAEFILYEDGPDAMADFSSRGPCEDGRIKPDVVAPGTWIASLQSRGATDENAWLPISPHYQYQGGTSQAGPQVSGAAAVFVQFYRETHGGSTPSPALVKAALINSAVELENSFGTDYAPNFDEGWGRVDLTQIIGTTRGYEFLDQSTLLQSGQLYEQRFLVGSPDEPLKITLAYTDVPGFPATIPALVNDLDLELLGPDGTVYHGNQFLAGESIPNPNARDDRNNVEGIHLSAPVAGDYLIRIRARGVGEDSRVDSPAVDQDFALVVSGDLPLPGTGIVVLNRRAYSVPATIEIRLIDADWIGRASIPVQLTSTTEALGELIQLRAAGNAGVFTGAVQTATGPATPNGRLEIAHGDSIEVLYQDSDQIRRATARADLRPPTISDIAAASRFGQEIISWTADEPVLGIVRYGTESTLSSAATNTLFTTRPAVALQGIIPEQLYVFSVIARDEAGNTATNDNNGQLFSFTMPRAPTVLLVDDFHDDPLLEISVAGYTRPLDETGVTYEIWDVAQQGSPSAADLRPYRVVIWRLPEFVDTPLTIGEQTALREYLNAGGSLFISSMELVSRLDAGGFQSFRREVLHVESYQEDVQVPAILGSDSEPISSGVDVDLDYSEYPDLIIIPSDLSDTLVPTTNAVPVFFDRDSGEPAALRHPLTGQDSPSRVVFFSFPFDAIPENDLAPNNRRNVLLNVLAFLAPGLNGLSTLALDRPSYSVPALVTIELADSDLVGRKSVGLSVVNTTSGAAASITLSETVLPGLFRGHLDLVSPTNSLRPEQLVAENANVLSAEYWDDSVSSVVRALATIDLDAPVISGREVEPDYSDAVVRWTTSEPADALVAFGESPFLNRTAYDPALTEFHEVTLTGLLPDKTYYFKIISRDEAGNAGVDDNFGELHQFRTDKPLSAPWHDDFESGVGAWLVFSEDWGSDSGLSVTEWQLGEPNNGWESSAVSPTHAWGSNLDGQPIDAAGTDLISPPVELSGGNAATLHFWQSYDFTERSEFLDIEYGEVYVSTDNGNNWTALAQFSELTDGWEPVEIDLTPYLGKIVRLGWHYQLLALESFARPGWLIDDVSVVVTNAPRGTLEVSANLAQSRFEIAGPVNRSVEGPDFVLTNAPAGTYTVTFSPVPYYATPGPQTRDLSSGGIAAFSADYTFSDGNQNGMSDAWETAFFQEVSPARNRTSDSDGDGASDYGEFHAGTDPTDPAEALRVLLPTLVPNGTVRLEWTSTSGRMYQVLGSTNAVTWVPYSAGVRATGTNTTYTLPPLRSSASYLFQISVQP